MFCSQQFYAPKEAETTCFVTFLSGHKKKKKKKKQPFLDSFKMSKEGTLLYLFAFYAFFVCKNFL